MNLCTDQLALLIAAPGQVVSVSHLARDPHLSLMTEQAVKVGVNYGQAEEISLLAPDLVLTGDYETRPTAAMLRRLGVRVEAVPMAGSLDDVRAAITRTGALLGREARAAELIAGFDRALAALPAVPEQDRPLAASWGANGYTAGRASLSGEVMRAAGLALLADRLGMAQGGPVPLESLVMADPDLIVTGSRYDPPSRAEAVTTHPALAAMRAKRVHVADRDWICGLPQIALVARALAK